MAWCEWSLAQLLLCQTIEWCWSTVLSRAFTLGFQSLLLPSWHYEEWSNWCWYHWRYAWYKSQLATFPCSCIHSCCWCDIYIDWEPGDSLITNITIEFGSSFTPHSLLCFTKIFNWHVQTRYLTCGSGFAHIHDTWESCLRTQFGNISIFVWLVLQ